MCHIATLYELQTIDVDAHYIKVSNLYATFWLRLFFHGLGEIGAV